MCTVPKDKDFGIPFELAEVDSTADRSAEISEKKGTRTGDILFEKNLPTNTNGRHFKLTTAFLSYVTIYPLPSAAVTM